MACPASLNLKARLFRTFDDWLPEGNPLRNHRNPSVAERLSHLSIRTHLSIGRNAPAPRNVESRDQGEVVAIPVVGDLHHRYTRAA